MDTDTSMNIHAKSVDMDMDVDRVGKFHIHGNPGFYAAILRKFVSAEAIYTSCCLAYGTITGTITELLYINRAGLMQPEMGNCSDLIFNLQASHTTSAWPSSMGRQYEYFLNFMSKKTMANLHCNRP